eukprot:m.86965 g.86965  ORF g.86965 m.86965 type:complete len:95 (+) comp13080_c0_seq2:1118-1402(+)
MPSEFSAYIKTDASTLDVNQNGKRGECTDDIKIPSNEVFDTVSASASKLPKMTRPGGPPKRRPSRKSLREGRSSSSLKQVVANDAESNDSDCDV